MFAVTPLPAFDDNYIWTLKTDSDFTTPQAVVVDPGDADVVEAYLAEHGLELLAILITHHHKDHTGGVAQLQARRDGKLTVYGPHNSPFDGVNHPVKQGDTIEVLGSKLDVHQTPGHTLDHICYITQTETPQLFCGDTLFLAGCGRLFEGSAAQMLAAMNWFRSLPDTTEVYCTHEYSLSNLAFAGQVEPKNLEIQASVEHCEQRRTEQKPTLPSSIGREKLINPFMRTHEPAVKQAAEHFARKPLNGGVCVLAALREWKNRG